MKTLASLDTNPSEILLDFLERWLADKDGDAPPRLRRDMDLHIYVCHISVFSGAIVRIVFISSQCKNCIISDA